jgi:hypothetical protein
MNANPSSREKVVFGSALKQMVGEQLTQTERDARDLDLAIKLIAKLEDGPLTARELVRKKNRLLSGDCRRMLELYERSGVARRVENDKWELTLPVAQAVKKIRAPYVEV